MTPPVRFLDRRTPPHILTLVLISGLPALSLNIFLPSLPSMAEWFGVDYALMQLAVSLYLAMTALIQIFIGPVSDTYGRRPVLLAMIAVFVVATIGAMLAPNYAIFLACRLLQAAIATGFALSRAVVRDMVDQDQAASMIGYVTMGMSIVPMVGPVIGGALDELFGWQASFILMAVGGVALFALVWSDLGETATRHSGGMLAQVRQYPELLRAKRFWGYCGASAFSSGAFFAYLGGAPFVGQEIFHLDAATLGFYFGAPAVGYLAGNYLSGRFATRIGINRMMMGGALVTTAGLALLTVLELIGIVGPNLFFGLIIAVGIGNGMLLPSANAGMLSVRPHLAGSAAGLGGAITVGGGAALSALAGVLLTRFGGVMPLVLLMLVTSALSIVSILWVMQRAAVLRRS